MALRGDPARIGLSGRQVTDDGSFLHGAITRMAAGKEVRGRERGGRGENLKKPPVGAGTYAKVDQYAT